MSVRDPRFRLDRRPSDPRRGPGGPDASARVPVTVTRGAYVAAVLVTVFLGAATLPAAVPDRSGFAYFTAGLAGTLLLFGVLFVAERARAAVARRAGAVPVAIDVTAAGPRLRAAGTVHDPLVTGRLAAVGLAVTGLAGAGLVAFGAVAPGGRVALTGELALWVGIFVLLLTITDLLPAPRSAGGRLLRAALLRRGASRWRADSATARAGVITGWTLVVLGFGAIYAVGLLGLWAVLLGWLTVSASRLEQGRLRARGRLDGLAVRDVMSGPPTVLAGWRTVHSALADSDDVGVGSAGLAAGGPRIGGAGPGFPAAGILAGRVFAVHDLDGALAGVVTVRDLLGVPADDRGLRRVRDVMIPMTAVARARPDEPAGDLLDRMSDRAAPIALVVDGDEPDAPLVGMVTALDLTTAVAARPVRNATWGV
jgi:CBS domain-containing protein